MEFTVLRSALKSALDNLKSTVKPVTGDVNSTLAKLRINATNQEMELVAYNLEVGAISVIEVESLDYGEFLVNLDKLAAIVAKYSSETLECVVENEEMTIKSGRSKVKIPIQNAGNYPSIPDLTSSNKIVLNATTLADMIRQTVFAVAITDNKPILMGELFDIENNSFNLVAIDGFRLAIRNEAVSTEQNYHFVVKGDTLRSVAKLAKDGDVVLIPSKKHIVFDFGKTKIFTRLLEGDFHNYKKSIPQDGNTEVTVDTKPLIECLERFCLLIDSKSKSALRCNFSGDKLDMSLKTIQGEMQDSVDIDFVGTPVEIGFNVHYLLDTLKASESDKVKFKLNGGLSPMVVKPLEGDSYTYLVLPVRLKNN